MKLAASFDVLESISKVIFILNVYFRSSSALSMSLFKVLITFKLFLCLSRIYPRFLNDPSLPHLTICTFFRFKKRQNNFLFKTFADSELSGKRPVQKKYIKTWVTLLIPWTIAVLARSNPCFCSGVETFNHPLFLSWLKR